MPWLRKPEGGSMKRRLPCQLILVWVLLLPACLPLSAMAQQDAEISPPNPAAEPPPVLTLKTAVMCEKIQNFDPVYPAVVFSISTERIICYNLFDPVPDQTVIFHKWYRKDTLSKRTRLTLKPPRWATFSSILLREGDKGPWRVEIADETGKILRVLRFSITD
jgi:hypothetical protein